MIKNISILNLKKINLSPILYSENFKQFRNLRCKIQKILNNLGFEI